MGQLIDGEWVKGSVSTNDKKGNGGYRLKNYFGDEI